MPICSPQIRDRTRRLTAWAMERSGARGKWWESLHLCDGDIWDGDRPHDSISQRSK
jgi:hypothetical protein